MIFCWWKKILRCCLMIIVRMYWMICGFLWLSCCVMFVILESFCGSCVIRFVMVSMKRLFWCFLDIWWFLIWRFCVWSFFIVFLILVISFVIGWFFIVVFFWFVSLFFGFFGRMFCMCLVFGCWCLFGICCVLVVELCLSCVRIRWCVLSLRRLYVLFLVVVYIVKSIWSVVFVCWFLMWFWLFVILIFWKRWLRWEVRCVEEVYVFFIVCGFGGIGWCWEVEFVVV